MAAVPSDESWLDLQRRREERMRFEVLSMLYEVTEGKVDEQRNAWSFAVDLGIWHAELFRVVEWLAGREFIRYCGAGPMICLTDKGLQMIQRDGRRRRSIRDSDL